MTADSYVNNPADGWEMGSRCPMGGFVRETCALFGRNADFAALNHWERDIKTLAGEAHDCGLDDLPELARKLGEIKLVCEEWLSLARRRSEERQTQEADDCCPVVETYSIGRI